MAKIPAKGVAGLIFAVATLGIFSSAFLLAGGCCSSVSRWD